MIAAVWHKWQAYWRQRRLEQAVQKRRVPEALWEQCVRALPFVRILSAADLARLKNLVSLFLDTKEFHGARGLVVTDRHAVMVGIQACMPLLHIAPKDRPDLALAWYDSFVGIVLYPAQMRARREWEDEHGIVHQGSEILAGEVLEGGPLVLAWSDVASAGASSQQAYNVVIHEFAHVMDLRDGIADACPPMPKAQRAAWMQVMESEYTAFREKCDAWARFGGADGLAQPLLDDYAATRIEEFFAVAAEAYFVNPAQFAAHHRPLQAVFDEFFVRT